MLAAMTQAHARKDILRLAAKADCDPRTAAKWLRGEPSVLPAIARELAVAAKSLGLEPVKSASKKKVRAR